MNAVVHEIVMPLEDEQEDATQPLEVIIYIKPYGVVPQLALNDLTVYEAPPVIDPRLEAERYT